jgi:Tfp pilus assembly protein PilO
MNNLKIYLSRYNILGWPLASIAISILLIIFIIIPQILGLKENNDAISDIKSRTEMLNAKATSLSSVETSTYRDNLKVALTVLPEEKDIPAAIGQVQSLMLANKLTLDGMSFAHSNTGGSGLENYQIKIDATGDQAALKNFINNLKDAPLIMKISGLEITSNSQDSTVSTNLGLTTYYQGSDGNLGGLEDPIKEINQSDSDLLAKLKQRIQSLPLITTAVSSGPRGKSDPFQ